MVFFRAHPGYQKVHCHEGFFLVFSRNINFNDVKFKKMCARDAHSF